MNALGKAIKAALIPIKDWKRLTTITINMLKNKSTQKR
jgi:hypothetical protein